LYCGEGELICCGKPMELLVENTRDAKIEKHLPVLLSVPGGTEANVGAEAHPMAEKHYIAFIEVVTVDNLVLRVELKPATPDYPGDEPKVFFPIDIKKILYVREYCNLHGLWKTVNDISS
jgi:superoxide reductase